MDVDIAISLARSSLGYSELKPKQLEVVKAFVLGNDVFVSLPTWYGKSEHKKNSSLSIFYNVASHVHRLS